MTSVKGCGYTPILGALALCTLWMGVYPQPFTEVMHASVNDLLRHVAISKIQ